MFSVIRPRLFILAAAFLAVSSCATYEEVDVPQIPMWPAAPDPPRFMYELSLRSDLSIAKESVEDKFQQAALRSAKTPQITLTKPFDVAARNGRIIVSDTVTRLVYLFDVPRRELLVFGTKGDGKLVKPAGVATDDNVNYYVADVTGRKVMVFDAIGHFKREIGGKDDLVRPSDVAVTPDGERVYVVDTGGIESMDHRIVVYDKEGKKLSTIGKRGVGDGEFNLPTHAAIGPAGNLYVLDAGNFRVQVFDAEGKFLRAFGGVGTGYGSLARPRGIGVDTDGNIYVTDAAFRNFQIFNPDGQLLMFIGNEKGREDAPGTYVLPAGIAVDETNRVYVVDQYLKKVEVIRRLGDEESKKLAKERQ